MVKRYEELTIADDFMFGKVMEDKEICHDALEQLVRGMQSIPSGICAKKTESSILWMGPRRFL